MNWLDISLGFILVVSTLAGLSDGFTKAAIGFLSSVFGLLLALQNYRAMGRSLHGLIHEGWVANLVGFMIIFVFITMVGAVASGMLARFIRAIELGWLDRTLGAAFGFVRGLLMATVVIWGIMAFIPVLPKYLISDSRLAPYVMDSARRIADSSPEEVKEGFRNSYRELNKVLPERIKERLSTAPHQI